MELIRIHQILLPRLACTDIKHHGMILYQHQPCILWELVAFSMCEQYKSQDVNSDEHQTSMWQASCLLGRVWSGGAHLKHRENFQPAPVSSKCFVFLLFSVFSPQIPYMHKITDSHAGHRFQWICCLEAIKNVSPFLHNPKTSSVSSVTLHVNSWPPPVALNHTVSFISSLNLPVVKSFLAKCWKPHTSLL